MVTRVDGSKGAPTIKESEGGVQNDSWLSWFTGPNFSIYSCHFLSSWSGRMWAFSMGLFLIHISPTSLQLSATYGLSMGAAVLLFGAILGDWVDKTPRLKAALGSMILQNIFVITCSCVVFTFIMLQSELNHLTNWLRQLFYASIITLSVLSRLMKVARVIVVERDWIVEMCLKDEHHLAIMTSSFRRIDLLTKILAPIVTGQIMTYLGVKIGCGFIASWSLVSLGVEYFLIRRVYNIVPALTLKKDRMRFDASMEYEVEAQNEEDLEFTRKDEQLNPRWQEEAKASEAKRVTRAPSKGVRSILLRLFASFLILYRGFRTYVSYDVMFAGLALASLYLTVLGFDSITVGYATTQGFTGSVLGILMGTGAVFGIMATFTYPFIVKALGLPKTGVLALGLQVTCLSMCVISVWLPGSPFDLSHNIDEHSNTSVAINCTEVLNATQRSLYQAVVNTTDEDFEGDLNANSTSFQAVTNRTCIDDQSKSGVAHISGWVMMAGIVTARFGLWTADLTIIQLFLERVVPVERGIVNGFQSSLNQLMDFLKYAIVVAVPHPHQFGLLVMISFCFILTGWTLMCVYAVRATRRLKKKNVIKSGGGIRNQIVRK